MVSGYAYGSKNLSQAETPELWTLILGQVSALLKSFSFLQVWIWIHHEFKVSALIYNLNYQP